MTAVILAGHADGSDVCFLIGAIFLALAAVAALTVKAAAVAAPLAYAGGCFLAVGWLLL
jgi:hypothetical protein